MADNNGEIPLTGDPRIDAALERIKGKFQDLEDAFFVQAQIEKKQSEALKIHAEWLVHHDEVAAQHAEWILHFDSKLSLLTDILMRRTGGPENPQ